MNWLRIVDFLNDCALACSLALLIIIVYFCKWMVWLWRIIFGYKKIAKDLYGEAKQCNTSE